MACPYGKSTKFGFFPRGNMSHILDGGVYDSATKVKTLLLKVCKEAKIKTPPHLIG
jgi:hypothetical protein